MKAKHISFTVRDADFPIIARVDDYADGLLFLSSATTKEKQSAGPDEMVDLGTIAVPLGNIVGVIRILRIRLGRPEEKNEKK